MNEHFVSTFQQVGQFKVTSEYRPGSSKHTARLQKQGGNLVSYFCTPDGRILNFVVGPVGPDTVLRAANWSLEQHRAAGDDLEPFFADAQRAAHLAELPPNFRDLFDDLRAKVELPNPPPVEEIIDLGLQTQGQLMAPRFAGYPPGPQYQAIKTQLAKAAAAGALPHLILSQRPLAKLDDVSKPIFESLAGEAFNPYGPRNELLVKQVRQNIDDRVPTLLVVEPQKGADADLLLGDQEIASPLTDNLSIKRHLESMRLVSLSKEELTWLLADLGQSVIAVKRGTSIRYVVLDARGERIAALNDKTSSGVLARFMTKAIETAPDR